MTSRRLQVGRAGEAAARAYLEYNGYSIVSTNYRCHLGEIDLVARHERMLIFIEVRTKTVTTFGNPEESITREKARRLRRLTLQYMQAVYKKEVPCRIDLVAVMLDKDDLSVKKLNHLRGILAG